MIANPVEPFEFSYDNWFVVRTLFTMIPFTMFFLALLVWTVILVFYLIEVCKCDGEDADEEEMESMIGIAGWSLKTLQMSDRNFYN